MCFNYYSFFLLPLLPLHSFLLSFNKQLPRWPGPCSPGNSSGLSSNLSGTAVRRASALTPALVSVSGVSEPERCQQCLGRVPGIKRPPCPGDWAKCLQSSGMAKSQGPKNYTFGKATRNHVLHSSPRPVG